MADVEAYYDEEELFQDRSDNIADLQAYYMSQFNLELETGNKNKSITDNFKYGNEESFDFEILETSLENNHNTNVISADFGATSHDINEYNIKEVLLDLDNIDFDDTSYTNESCSESKVQTNFFENNDYIDDESLLDELCREDGESCRLTPETYNEQYFTPITNEKNSLPSIETAFSKHYSNFNSLEENNSPYFAYDDISGNQTTNNNTVSISSLEHYSYPNNILYNLENEKSYILPDTPTSCSEFNFRGERKVSVSDSIESDVQSSSYYDENSETFDEDELFVNLEDFGLILETENEIPNKNKDEGKRTGVQNERRYDKDKTQGERICLWEHCYEKYPSQSTLVEHIERAHVNTYKGDEFSCLWRDCARSRRPFNARYKLLIHMRVHSGHKPNRCHHPGCGKAFSRLENLKIHVRSHTGERPYACPAPHCRKAFSNSSDRAKHQRTHFNARPYACGAAGCGKRYTDPSSLRKHVKSHPHPAVRTCVTPPRPTRRPSLAHLVPTSPAKLATLRSIRDKINVPRLQRL